MTQTIITGGRANGKTTDHHTWLSEQIEIAYRHCIAKFGLKPRWLLLTNKMFDDIKNVQNSLNTNILNPNKIYWGDDTEVVINNAISKPYFIAQDFSYSNNHCVEITIDIFNYWEISQ